jgi:succinate-semialdehyde dehydrogenase/glutarate-semialdehyde dehydrogenase
MTFKSEEEALRLRERQHLRADGERLDQRSRAWQKVRGTHRSGYRDHQEVLYTHAIGQTPWGGVKQSGIGRTHGRAGPFGNGQSTTHPRESLCLSSRCLVVQITLPRRAGLFRGLAKRFSSGSLFQMLLLLPQLIRRLNERR